MRRRLWTQLVAVAALAVAIVGLVSATGSASTRAPSVRLLSVLKHTEIERIGGADLVVDGVVNVASVGGAFEVDPVVGEHGDVALWQVRRDSRGAHRIRQLTAPAKVHLATGFPEFFHTVVKDPTGKPVLDTVLPFCPGGDIFGQPGRQSRTDPTGPPQATYPFMCGSDMTRVGVWGIDRSWATSPQWILPGDGIADGDYTMDVAITPSWVRQLGIPAEWAAIHVAITVATVECPPEVCAATRPASSAAATPRGEGPRTRAPAGSRGDDGMRGSGSGIPDLAALPAHNMSTENNADNHHDYLDFAATIWNGGSGPLVVEGFRQGADPVMAAKQYVYRDGQPVRSVDVGQFEFDTRPGHNHWHMEDIAQYDLLDASGQRIVLSEKQSFCLGATDPVDLSLKGADWQPEPTELWSACSGEHSIWLREILPVGWGDTYYQDVGGQSFDLTGLPNGRYQVRVTTDPADTMLETNYANNVAVQPIEIGGPPGNRTVELVR